MKFYTIEETDKYYNYYAYNVGFRTKVSSNQKSNATKEYNMYVETF